MTYTVAPVGFEFTVNTETSGHQGTPTIANLANGGFVITWLDDSRTLGDSSFSSIKAQVFGANGEQVGNEFLVNTVTSGAQQSPAVTGLANGGFTIAWEDNSGTLGDSSFSSIKAQVFDAIGVKVGEELLVNTETSNSQLDPNIAGLVNGGFIITWQDESRTLGDTDRSSVKAQLFDPTGLKVGDEFLVNTQTADGQAWQTITGLPNGGFVISWWDRSATLGDSSSGSIKAQIFDASGVKVGGDFLVNTQTAGEQGEPTITGLSSGDFVIAWKDNSGTLGDSSYGSIKAQVFDPTGLKVGDEFLVNTQTFHNQGTPTITGLSNGGFIVSWWDSSARNDNSDGSVKAQAFDALGAKVGGEFLVNTQTFKTSWYPTITGLSNGSFIVAWENQFPTAASSDVKAQMYSVNTSPAITSNSGSDTASVNVAENGTAVTTVQASDPELNATLSYSISGGVDAALFDINATSGALSFKSAPNFEAPADAGANNVYDVVVQVSDGTLTDTQAIAVAVTNVNEAPLGALQILTYVGSVSSTPAAEFLVNTYTNGDQLYPATAGLLDGGWVVTWGSQDNVYGQRYAKSGVAVGSEFRVNTYTEGQQYAPSVTSLLDGGWLITWKSREQDGSASGVYGQRYSSAGEALGQEFKANTYTQYNQDGGAATGLSDGGWVITWSSEIQDGSSYGVYGQRYTNAGVATGGEFRVNTTTNDHQSSSSISALADGGWIITWTSFGQDGPDQGVYGQRYSSSGAAVGGEFLVNTNTAGNQAGSSVTGLSDGGWLVTWQSDLQDGSGSGVYGQRYSNVGAKVGIEFQINTFTAGGQGLPHVAALTDGGWMVTWNSLGQDGSASGIYGQRYTASGVIVGSEFRVNTYTNSTQAGGSMAALTDGGWFVNWYSQGQQEGVNSYNVFGQRYDAAGNMAYTYSDPPVVAAISDFIEGRTLYADASLITDPDGMGTVTWQWQRSTDGGVAWSDISSATGSSYTLVQSDVDSLVRLKGSYTDGGETFETVYSPASTAVINVNDAPTIVSNAGGDTASVNIDENAVSVAVVNATDPNANTTLSYSISGGVDAALFDINATSGALSFKSAPNFEAPADAGANNVYDVIVHASDGSLTDTQAIAVTVTNVNEAPSGALRILSQVEQTFMQPASEFRVNTYTTGDQYAPSVTALADGGWLVTWTSVGQDDGQDWGVYGQRYSSAGSTVGSQFRVNTYTTSSQKEPSVTALSDGGWLVTWTSYGQDGSVSGVYDSGVYGQRYNSAGSTVGSEFRVNTYTTNSQKEPSVTALSDGGWLVTWSSNGQDGLGSGVYGQRYNSAGSTVGSEFQVNTYTTSFQNEPSLTALADGGWLVTWHSIDQDGSSLGVYGQRYNSAGSTVGSEFPVNTYTADSQYGPSVTALSDGGWLVTWSSYRQDGSDFGVYGQRYSSEGSTVGSEFQVNTYTAGDQSNPSVTALSDGGWLVTWQSFYQDDGQAWGVYGQRYSSAGSTVGSEFPVNTYTAGDQSNPSVTALSDGGWLVAWQSFSQDGSDYGVYGQRYDAAGNKAYTYTVPNIEASASDFAEDKVLYADASLIADPDGMETVTWQWQRSNDGGATWLDITGAGGVSYALGDDDIGKLIRVEGTYTDGSGFVNTLYSGASTPISYVNDAPTVTSNGAGANASLSIAENTTAVTTVTATDPDPSPTLTYSIVGGADASLFQINAATGALSFKVAPNFEAPTDVGANNVYDVVAQVSDGTLTDTQAIAVTVTDVDEIAPTISTFTPVDAATGVTLSANIVVTFSEAIARGTGTIQIRSGSATGTIVESFNAATSNRLTVSDTTLTIDPTRNLSANTQYFVVFTSGNIKDIAGNVYAGISDYDFRTQAPDTTAPTFTSATTSADGFKVILTYNEALGATTAAKTAFAVKVAGVTTTVNSVAVNGSTVELTLATSIGAGQAATVGYTAPTRSAATTNAAVQDIAGNDAATLSSSTTVTNNSTVDKTAPIVSTFTPSDGLTGVAVGANIALTFSEAIARGTGTITLRSGSATGTVVESFDAASSGRLTLSGSTLSIDPTSNLSANTQYFVVFTSANIKDTAGNAYAGTRTYDFRTVNIINGTATNNTLTGTVNADTINGLAGNDIITGGAGTDSMDGGEGSDLYIVAASADHSAAEFADTGTSGTDEVRFTSTTANATLTLYAGDTGIEKVVIGTGTAAAAVTTATTALNINASALNYGITLVGNAGANVLTGGIGNDTLQGGAGNDTLNGGDGFDFADYSTAITAITISLALSSAQITGGAGTDTLSNIEGLIGSSAADRLTGNAADNILIGGGGNDTISGGDGFDQLRGGAGNDTLTGGTGIDWFIFDTTPNATSNRDTIIDFTSGTDNLQFSKAIFTGLSGAALGDLSSNAFWSGAGVTTAHDADDRFIYNTTNGSLYYDADGNASGSAAVLVATLGATTPLAFTDLVIFG